MSVISLI